MKKISIFISLLFFLSIASLCFAEEIKLKSGKTINAKIVERTDKYIKVDIVGVSITYFNDEIESIDGQKIQLKSLSTQPSKKTPEQIFKQASNAIVVIKALSSTGPILGSGFIVDKTGVIITNFHVVAGAEEVEIKLKDGKGFPVTGIIDFDKQKDLCILKINASGLTTLALGNSDTLEQGEKILVIGAPLGLEYTISDGLISGIREIFGQKTIQFTAPASKGNSGGPLINMHGEVVGIASSIRLGGQNLNFAIPINEAKKYIHTQVKMSVKEFSHAVSKNYHFVGAAKEAFLSDNIDSAISYLQQAIELDPEEAFAHGFLGYIYGLKNMSAEAISELERSIALFEKAPASDEYNNYSLAHSNLGQLYMQVGRLEEGISECNKAIILNPDNVDAYIGLGTGYYVKGMPNEAIVEFKKAITINPSHSDAHYNLAMAYYKIGQYDLAIEYYDRAIKLGSKPNLQFFNDLQPYRR